MDITLDAILKVVNAFGMTGVTAFLLWERATMTKGLTDALNKFTVAVNVLCGKGSGE